MWRRFLIQFFLINMLLVCASKLDAQTVTNDAETIEQKAEFLGASSDREVDFTQLQEDKDAAATTPLCINKATRNEIEQSNLFNDLQINALLYHRAKFGTFDNIYELQALPHFSIPFIKSILPYITLDGVRKKDSLWVKKLFTEGDNQLVVRTQQQIEQSKGYQIQDTSKSRYLGSPLKLYARYRYNFRDKLQVGVIAEKDAGEQFFQGTQKAGFDYYSAHVLVRNQGWLRTLALGDYQLNYGQGLVMWSGLAFSKTSDVLAIKKFETGIKPYVSTNESALLRGVAVSVGSKKVQLDAFFSHKGLDGNVVQSDSITNKSDVINSISLDGYHRTPNEVADKNSLQETLWGGHLHYSDRHLDLGATFLNQLYSTPIVRTASYYNQYEFGGQKNMNLSANYGYQTRNISLFGEAATSANGGKAFLNGILLALDPKLSFSVLQRKYDKNYQAFYSNGFSEGSRTINEDGLYWGIQFLPSPQVTVSAYYDRFDFPWRKYLVASSSKGYDAMVQVDYRPSKRISFYVRASQQSKGRNSTDEDLPIDNVIQVNTQKLRLNADYRISPSFLFKNRVELMKYEPADAKAEEGFMIYQDIIYNPVGSRLKVSVRYALFETDSYNARIYAYESDVLYYYYIPAYYYSGTRTYVLLQYRLAKGLDLWLRYASTNYANQKTIGSGLDLINGNTKSEIKAQLRWQF